MKSIRTYLIVVLLSTICLVNFVAALNGYRTSTEAGKQILDDELVHMAHMLGRMSVGSLALPQDLFGEDALFQVWSGDQLQARSGNAPATMMSPLHDGFHIFNHAGVQWRTYVYRAEHGGHWVIYGSRYDLFRKLIDTLVLESILPIIWALPIIGLLVWLIVSHGLRPLRLFAETLTRRDVNELTPIDDDRFPGELSAVVRSTNKLFSRLAGAFDREQRFAADAAHELRTPLAALKINLHNLSRDNNSVSDDFAELQASARRMESMIEQILTLYRLTPENFQDTLESCSVKAVIQQVIIDLYDSLQSKMLNIELLGENIEIEAAPFALSMLIKNLIDNAIKYTPEGGRITVQLSSRENNDLMLAIEDSGPGIPEEDYEFVFERFYRVGRDRHDSGVIGSGLGLSIVNHVIQLHHGNIELGRSDTLGGLAVTVTLPQRQPQAQDLVHE